MTKYRMTHSWTKTYFVTWECEAPDRAAVITLAEEHEDALVEAEDLLRSDEIVNTGPFTYFDSGDDVVDETNEITEVEQFNYEDIAAESYIEADEARRAANGNV